MDLNNLEKELNNILKNAEVNDFKYILDPGVEKLKFDLILIDIQKTLHITIPISSIQKKINIIMYVCKRTIENTILLYYGLGDK